MHFKHNHIAVSHLIAQPFTRTHLLHLARNREMIFLPEALALVHQLIASCLHENTYEEVCLVLQSLQMPKSLLSA